MGERTLMGVPRLPRPSPSISVLEQILGCYGGFRLAVEPNFKVANAPRHHGHFSVKEHAILALRDGKRRRETNARKLVQHNLLLGETVAKECTTKLLVCKVDVRARILVIVFAHHNCRGGDPEEGTKGLRMR